jgi:hypothetical protein
MLPGTAATSLTKSEAASATVLTIFDAPLLPEPDEPLLPEDEEPDEPLLLDEPALAASDLDAIVSL